MRTPAPESSASNTSFIASTFSGLEEMLANELQNLGATEVQVLRRAVSFSGDEDIFYKANYQSRLSLRILKPIKSFTATTPYQLYEGAKSIDWMKIMDLGNTFLIDSIVSGNNFKHSHYAAQKVKDAIADQFRDRFGRRPDVDIEHPQIRIHLKIHEDQATLSLDSSGESLHRRGYRQHLGQAPLSEVLASALLTLSGWDESIALYDPMCGSGTILTEAVMMARRMPAGYFRKAYSFMHWPDYSRMRWQRVKKEADKQIRPLDTGIRIMGSDINDKAVEWSTENLKILEAGGIVQVMKSDFLRSSAPWPDGMIISNPPYGIRIKTEDLQSLYRDIGSVLRNSYPGWSVWLFSSDVKALKQTGMKPGKWISLYNGPLECRFSQYDVRRRED